ncbi:GNAT family N-acetyltransferase [Streptomyces sp. bgisy100]|uniref:GNAT family N-acetyltransferase n=1 Tax=Streptomyces sp. bgisy100 TaxID=3413783 RepID=UPI003D72C387
MTTESRVLRRDEWDTWYSTLELAFGGVAEPAEERELWQELTEVERSIGVWDGGSCVGTAGAFSFRMCVPGGRIVPAAGVTMVGVTPTHRRQGVLRSMMRRQLDDVRARGESLAVLTASDPAVYGRFGYGTASERMSVEVDTERVRLTVPPGTDDVRLRLVPPREAQEVCEALYAERVTTRPGMLARLPGWERLPLLDAAASRAGASPLQCVLAERDGAVTGYARYAVRPDWEAAGPTGTVVLRDVEARDPASYAALWRFLCDMELTVRITHTNRPVDDPLLQLVSDVRRCNIRIRDQLHVRLVEVGAALAARTYAAPVDVVFEVADAFCPWNGGRWRLTGDARGASCEPTGDEPDLRLSVRELGAAYLGGCTLTALADAGRVQELRPDALAEASAAFRSDRAPWLPHGF